VENGNGTDSVDGKSSPRTMIEKINGRPYLCKLMSIITSPNMEL